MQHDPIGHVSFEPEFKDLLALSNGFGYGVALFLQATVYIVVSRLPVRRVTVAASPHVAEFRSNRGQVG
jgi:hypothetical protein